MKLIPTFILGVFIFALLVISGLFTALVVLPVAYLILLAGGNIAMAPFVAFYIVVMLFMLGIVFSIFYGRRG